MSAIQSYMRSIPTQTIIEAALQKIGTKPFINLMQINCTFTNDQTTIQVNRFTDLSIYQKEPNDPNLKNLLSPELESCARKKATKESPETRDCLEYKALLSYLTGDQSSQVFISIFGAYPRHLDKDQIDSLVAQKLEQFPSLLIFAFEQAALPDGFQSCKSVIDAHLDHKKNSVKILTQGYPDSFAKRLRDGIEEVVSEWKKSIQSNFQNEPDLEKWWIRDLLLTFKGCSLTNQNQLLIGELTLIEGGKVL